MGYYDIQGTRSGVKALLGPRPSIIRQDYPLMQSARASGPVLDAIHDNPEPTPEWWEGDFGTLELAPHLLEPTSQLLPGLQGTALVRSPSSDPALPRP